MFKLYQGIFANNRLPIPCCMYCIVQYRTVRFHTGLCIFPYKMTVFCAQTCMETYGAVPYCNSVAGKQGRVAASEGGGGVLKSQKRMQSQLVPPRVPEHP